MVPVGDILVALVDESAAQWKYQPGSDIRIVSKIRNEVRRELLTK